MQYGLIAIFIYLILIHILRIIYLFWKPRFLEYKIFHFPTTKYHILGYYVITIFSSLIFLLYKLELIK